MNKPITKLLAERSQLVAGGLALATCILGLTYSLVVEDAMRFGDENTYVSLAQNIAASGAYSLDGVTPTSFRPPGYAAILSVPAALGGGIRSFRCVNYIALSISIILAYLIAMRQFGPLAGALTAGMVFAFPVFFFAAGTIFPQTVASCLLLAAIWLLFRKNSLDMGSACVMGVLFGLVVLVTPTAVFTLLFTGIWILAVRCRRCIRKSSLVFAIALLVIGSWSVRHYRLYNSLVFVSTNGGLNLLLGNSENTTPNSGSTVNIAPYHDSARDMNEAERDRYFTRSALRFAAERPARWAKLYALKFLNYFNFRNNLTTRNEASRARDLIMLISYGALLLMALARLAMTGRWPLVPYEKFAYLLYVLNGAFSALFFTRIRFRIPFDFFLIMIAAAFVGRLLGEERRGVEKTVQAPSD